MSQCLKTPEKIGRSETFRTTRPPADEKKGREPQKKAAFPDKSPASRIRKKDADKRVPKREGGAKRCLRITIRELGPDAGDNDREKFGSKLVLPRKKMDASKNESIAKKGAKIEDRAASSHGTKAWTESTIAAKIVNVVLHSRSTRKKT